MPTYEFRCSAGHDFERFFGRISEAPSELPCPECGEIASRRISGGAGLLFKGSGFYITDYGKDGKKDQRAAASKSEGGEKKGAGTDAGSKAEGGTKSEGPSKNEGASKSEGPSKGEGSGKGGESSKPASTAKPSKPTSGE